MTRAAGRSDRWRLGRRARRRVGGVEVRGLRRELGGARVHHRVARDAGRAPGGRPDRALPHAGERGEVPVGVGGARLAVTRSAAASASSGSTSRAPIARTSCSSADVAAHLGEEPGRDPGRAADHLLRHAPAQQPEHPPQPRVGRLQELPQHDRRRRALGEPGALAGLPVAGRPTGSGHPSERSSAHGSEAVALSSWSAPA